MKQEIEKEALKVVQQRKRDALKEYENANLKVFAEEKYAEMQQKYQKMMIENAKKEAYGEKFSKNEELNLKKQLDDMKILKTPNFSCKKCNDEGYLNGQICTCLKTEISKLLLKESGFEKLENFADAIKTSGNLKDAYVLMQKWCKSDFKKTLIYLAGPVGVGKTYLLRCMANELINRGKIVKLSTAFNMNLDFRDFNKTSEQEIIKKYINTEVLFIDDLGTEPIYKNITLENLYLVLNERQTRHLPTVITSNLSLEDVNNIYGERIFSRIANRETSITLFLDDEDKRLKKHN